MSEINTCDANEKPTHGLKSITLSNTFVRYQEALYKFYDQFFIMQYAPPSSS